MKFKKVSEANLMKQIVNLACHFMYSIGSKTYFLYIYIYIQMFRQIYVQNPLLTLNLPKIK